MEGDSYYRLSADSSSSSELGFLRLVAGLKLVSDGSDSSICSFTIYFNLSTSLGIPTFQPHEMSVNGFCPLFSHQASSDSPFPHPWNNMVFKDMHFGENAGLRKLLPIETHKGD